MPDQSATSTLTRTITVAEGVFAPGHLGELTQYVPFELVDDVLERTRTVQARVRFLPSRVGVYFLLALGLFPTLGYQRVWDKLVPGLHGLDLHVPSEKGLRDLRRRLGPAPLRALFEVLAGPLARPSTPGVSYRHWRTVAFDGCSSIKAPDQPRIRSLLGKVRHHWGTAGYPVLRLTVLCETGTRGLLGAVFGPTSTGETTQASMLLPLLSPQVLLLADRGFDSDDLLGAIADTGAQLLVRISSKRRPAILATLPDGSYLTRFKGLDLRIIEADVTVTTSAGQRIGGRYRPATTLLDHRADPAEALVRLYHERWKIESAFYSLRHTLLTGRVLRSCDAPGLEQEMCALLVLYQALRAAMVDAVESAPGTDPDRASFTVALQSARDLVVCAGGVLPEGTDAPVTSGIAAAVLAALLPGRRPRISARKVKSPTSRYPANPTTAHPLTSQKITRLDIEIHREISRPDAPLAGGSSNGQTGAGRRNQVLQFLRAAPDRAWHPTEIAQVLGWANYRSVCAQLGYWAREGLLQKVARATYTLAPAWMLHDHRQPAQPAPLTDPSAA
ncbi:IS4 family transposase [Kitasatospora herbaricolor]|uniref:IS4 family transposase n=1 Tax=Kitasatospora herbaricolor TaxID=68217 RepID=A0ABZ1WLN4_9ACTN|nr:IS4 family transposase [Kitasatospora herbaricolor]